MILIHAKDNNNIEGWISDFNANWTDWQKCAELPSIASVFKNPDMYLFPERPKEELYEMLLNYTNDFSSIDVYTSPSECITVEKLISLYPEKFI